ncbi:MAG: ABC transporter ATP-binding protein [Spirochaetia bacterium]
MIRLERVSKYYGENPAVKNLSFTVQGGEVCVLIGPSGCGKSTTLKLINRLLAADSGEIFINNKNINAFKPELLRRKIGYVIQSIGLFPHMTVAENIATVPRLLSWDRAGISHRVDELLELIGLDRRVYRDKFPGELSGGEAQRIGVARALAADPPLLLMDEPFGAVDPLTREVLQQEFLNIQQELKKTVIFVTHDLNEAIRLADRIIIMRGGEIIQNDTPERVLSRPKNRFVRDFVGTDRVLKRLSRIPVATYMLEARAIAIDAKTNRTQSGRQAENRHFFWVTAADKRLLGWVDKHDLEAQSPVKQAMTRIDPKTDALNQHATLREALAHILSQNVRTIAVVDDKCRLVGEIGLSQIEKATEEVRENG